MIIDIAWGEEALYSTLSYWKNEAFILDNKNKEENKDNDNIIFNKKDEYYVPNLIGLGFKNTIDKIVSGLNCGGKRNKKKTFEKPKINDHFKVNIIEEDEDDFNNFNFLYESKLSFYLKNLIKITDIKLNDFSFYYHGEEYKNYELVSLIEDSVRFYLEKFDSINTFNFHYSVNSGFCYFINIFKEYIKDESPKSNIIFLPIQYNNKYNEDVFNNDKNIMEQKSSYNLINEIYHYGNMLDEVDCMIPLYNTYNKNHNYEDLNYFLGTDLSNFENIESNFYYQNFYFDNFLSNIIDPCYKTNHIKSLFNELKIYPSMNLFSCFSLFNSSKELYILDDNKKKYKLINYSNKDNNSVDSDDYVDFYNIFYNDDSLNDNNSSKYKSLYITNSNYENINASLLNNKINIQNDIKKYQFINSIDKKLNEIFINEEFLLSNDCIILPKINNLLQKNLDQLDSKKMNIIKEFSLEDDYYEYFENINKSLENYEQLYEHLK